MFQLLMGIFIVLFFGGGLVLAYLNKRDELSIKLIISCIVFCVIGVFMIFDSNIVTRKTVEMTTSDEVFDNNNTIIAGDFEYTVSNSRTTNTLKDYGTKIQANGKYLIFEVGIKNNTNYPFSIKNMTSPLFYLVNSERSYDLDVNLSKSLTYEEIGNTSYLSGNNFINPGNSAISYVVFDVPKEIIKSADTQLLIRTDDSAPNDIYI